MPAAAMIPMTTLAAVLIVVAWNMCDWRAFIRLMKKAPKSDIIVLVGTFLLTVIFDLVVAIEVGIVVSALLFMKRMAEVSDVKAWKYIEQPDVTEGEAETLLSVPKEIRCGAYPPSMPAPCAHCTSWLTAPQKRRYSSSSHT